MRVQRVLHGFGIPRRADVFRGKYRGAERRLGPQCTVCTADCVDVWSVMDCD